MTDQTEATAVPDFKDRKTRLTVLGILGIIAGALCVLVGLATLGVRTAATRAATQPAGAPAITTAMVILIEMLYLLLAVWFIWMGIGSIKARRWARALILVTSWMWLLGGIAGFASLLMRGDMYAPMVQSGKMSAAAASAARTFMLGWMFLLYVVVPVALVLFYGGKHVKATCERRDPKSRWTDRCPLPVLALSLIFGFSALSALLMGLFGSMLGLGTLGWALPLFGVRLSRSASAFVIVFIVLVNAYMAWGTYHLKVRAWWTAVLVLIFWAASTGVTFARVNMAELYAGVYAKQGYSPEQVEMMKSYIPSQSATIAISAVWLVVALAYLMYTRKFFVKPGVER